MESTLGPGFRVHALLFDMDGTLVNSIAVVERTWTRFADRHGIDADKVLAACHGRRTSETVADFAPPGVSIAEETARIDAEELADFDGIVEVEGATKLLKSIPAGRWAVVTSADRNLANLRMAAAGLPLPQVMVTAEDVMIGKPAPDGYLAAAEALGVTPANCLVFEDAPAGIQAGNAAGAKVIAVATTLEEQDLEDQFWIRNFTSLRVGLAADGLLHVASARQITL
ncbi:HAD family hydrolase (plasmid) [Thalassobaculum sp. OXR-137]|uniref:HAD family hydrolase n=1 Tax=Thalassobaculum sp. OXR-137 TaxID=3100173 RepID=UPI002AC9BEE0|nr:HAD family hydrolase [Thalassobaculum sp. OXR-137]WPZ37193.1 HAD family hydrolase [Thalassobaculum sp. OXR-137]